MEDKNIYYELTKVINEDMLVQIAVQGQRWEVEFMDDGTVELEKFVSDGNMYDIRELEKLLFIDISD